MTTIDLSAPLIPWTDAERVAHIRHENERAETRGGKLHRAEVEEIRDLYVARTMTVDEIARQFGISRDHVNEIARGRKWDYPPLPARPGVRRKADWRDVA